jgi:hypothetical protein
MPDGSPVAHPLTVRVGTPDDLHDVMELAVMGAEENGFLKPNPTKLLYDIWPALHRDGGIMGLVGQHGDKPIGAVLLRIISPWYSDARALEERAIYVHPDYRAGGQHKMTGKGSGVAIRLIEFSKTVALRMDMPLLIGVLSNDRTEAKVRLYERVIGKPAGVYFLFNAQTGGAVKAETTGT